MIATLENQEKSNRISATAISFGFHIAVIFLLLLISIPYEKEEDVNDAGGILINFGTSETGSGDLIPESTEAGVPVLNTPATTNQTDDQKDVVTQDIEASEVVKKTPVKKKVVETPVKVVKTNTVPTKTNTTVVAPPAPQKAKATFPGNRNNDVSSQGTTGGTGDQGKLNGSPYTNGQSDIGGGSNPLGKGGPGIGLNMTGRVIKKYPTVTDNSQKTGDVKVRITVDKHGNVTAAEPTRVGSTTDDTYLFSLAKQAALKTKLNESPDLVEQHGIMTFSFKVK